MNIHRATIAISVLGLAIGIAHANPKSESTELKPRGSFSFTTDFSGAKVYGSGPYRYRMILLNPKNGKVPLANQDYALSNSQVDLSFVKDAKKVFQGTTDAQGRTAVFAFNKKVPESGWNLRPRTGSGPFGEQMVVVDNNRNPHVAFEYALVVCEPDDHYIYRGITDASGQTAYVASQVFVNIKLYFVGMEPRGEKICEP